MKFQFLKGILGDCESKYYSFKDLYKAFQFLKGILGDCEPKRSTWSCLSRLEFQFLKGILGDCEWDWQPEQIRELLFQFLKGILGDCETVGVAKRTLIYVSIPQRNFRGLRGLPSRTLTLCGFQGSFARDPPRITPIAPNGQPQP